MFKKLIPMLALMIAGTLLVPAPAQAGGGAVWSFEGHGPFVEPVFVSGEEVHASTKLLISEISPKEEGYPWGGGPQNGPFFGYIAPRIGSKWASVPPLPGDAIRVGQVSFHETGNESMDVTLDFALPQLEPGHYVLLHCNEPCTRRIGFTMVSGFTVVESQGQAFIANRLNRVERSHLVGRGRLASRVRTLEKHAEKLKAVVVSMGSRIDSLEQAAMSATRRDLAPSNSNQPVLPWALFAAAAVGLILALRRRFGSFLSSRTTSQGRFEETNAG